MNLARKGKVFGLALVAGLFVTTVATMQAQSEPNVAGSDLVGSYSGDYYPTAKSHLAATINLNITEVVGDHVKGTFLLVPSASGRSKGTCRDNSASIEGTLQEKHLNLAVPADDKYCAGVRLDLMMKDGRLEGTFIPHFIPEVQIVLKRK